MAFTGSTAVGLEIMKSSHKHNLKRITLELGGKSANIINEDADMETAIDSVMTANYFNAG